MSASTSTRRDQGNRYVKQYGLRLMPELTSATTRCRTMRALDMEVELAIACGSGLRVWQGRLNAKGGVVSRRRVR